MGLALTLMVGSTLVGTNRKPPFTLLFITLGSPGHPLWAWLMIWFDSEPTVFLSRSRVHWELVDLCPWQVTVILVSYVGRLVFLQVHS